jgi:hypothetical protein
MVTITVRGCFSPHILGVSAFIKSVKISRTRVLGEMNDAFNYRSKNDWEKAKFI